MELRIESFNRLGRIPAQGRHMRVTPCPAQAGKNPGARQIRKAEGIGASAAQGNSATHFE